MRLRFLVRVEATPELLTLFMVMGCNKTLRALTIRMPFIDRLNHLLMVSL